MDKEHRFGVSQRYCNCKNSVRTFEDDLVARLRQISLTSTLRDTICLKERAYSAGKSLVQSEMCRVSTCNRTSFFPRLYDSRYHEILRDTPCVHLCIIGKKMTLHKRNHDQNSFFIRARNYSRRLKERSYAVQQKYRVTNQTTLSSSNGSKCQSDPCRHKLPYIPLPQIRDILPPPSQNSSSSVNSVEGHHYVLYHRRSTAHEDHPITILSPGKISIGYCRIDSGEHRHSAIGRTGSGCMSSLSFTSVDLMNACSTPDDSSRIMSPPPPTVKGLYPAACPAFPMTASFPECVIPEPDV